MISKLQKNRKMTNDKVHSYSFHDFFLFQWIYEFEIREGINGALSLNFIPLHWRAKRVYNGVFGAQEKLRGILPTPTNKIQSNRTKTYQQNLLIHFFSLSTF